MRRTVQVELVGRKIRQLRRQHKLTQTALAEKIGVHQSDLSRMEQGEYKVGLDTLLKILQTFDLSMGDFFEETDSGAGILQSYKSLSAAAQREIEDFIAFKRLQEQGGWSEGEGEGETDD